MKYTRSLREPGKGLTLCWTTCKDFYGAISICPRPNLRNRGETAHALQLDLFTSAAGFTAALYLHNYVLKFADAFEPLQTMWDFLLAAVIVIVAIAAITYWRKATR